MDHPGPDGPPLLTKEGKTNILFLTRACSEHGGGMERLSWELTHELAKQPDLQCRVIAPTDVLSHVGSAFFSIATIPQALAAAWQADVVHIGDPVLSLVGWLITKLLRKPVVVTVHGLDVSYANSFYKLYLQLFFRNFSAYIAISKYAAQQLARWDVNGKIEVIPPGVYDRMFKSTQGLQIPHPRPLSLVKERGDRASSTVDEVKLFTAGRLVERKGHMWFIKHVLPDLPENVIYVIAGSGPEDINIIRAAEENRVAERVILLGRADDEKLRKLYNSVDAFIQPNIKIEGNAEGFGLVLLEAALCELPVFASNIDGIPDAIVDGKNGKLLPSEDVQAWISALQDFIAHREQYQERAKAARQYTLANFRWKKIIPKYVELYLNL